MGAMDVLRSAALGLAFLVSPPANALPALVAGAPVVVEERAELVPSPVWSSSVAAHPGGFLAVYSPRFNDIIDKEGKLVGRFLDADGKPNAAPFDIGDSRPVRGIGTAFDGQDFIVVWCDEWPSQPQGQPTYALHFVRVGSDGVTSAVSTLESGTNALSFAVSAGETGVLIARTTAASFRTWVVTASGAVEGQAPIQSDFSGYRLSAGHSDGTWLIASESTPTTQSGSAFVRLAGDGKVIPGASSFLPGRSTWHSIAASAEGFAVARADVVGGVQFVSVPWEGPPVVANSIISPEDSLGSGLSLLSAGTGYGLLYRRRPAACPGCFEFATYQKLDASLAPVGEGIALIQVETNGLSGFHTSSGDHALVTWMGPFAELRGSQLSLVAPAALEPGIPLSVSYPDQSSPRVAPGVGGFLVTWQETWIPVQQWPFLSSMGRAAWFERKSGEFGRSFELRGEFIDVKRGPNGWLLLGLHSAALLSDAFQVQGVGLPFSAGVSQRPLRAAASPQGWLITWLEESPAPARVFAARVASDGTLAGVTEVAKTTKPYFVRAAYADGSYQVLWSDDQARVSLQSVPVTGAFPTPAATQLSTPPLGAVDDFDYVASNGHWWSWRGYDAGSYFGTSVGVEPTAYYPGPVLPLISVDGLALTGGRVQDTWTLQLGLASPNSALTLLASIPAGPHSDLSEAVDHHALAVTNARAWGDPTLRLRASLLTISNDTAPTGEGGAGGGGGSGAGAGGESRGTAGEPPTPPGSSGNASEGGESATPGNGGGESNEAGSAGRAPLGGSGEPSEPTGGAGQAGVNGADAVNTESDACGCRAVGSTGPARTSLGCLLALVLAYATRRRQRHL